MFSVCRLYGSRELASAGISGAVVVHVYARAFMLASGLLRILLSRVRTHVYQWWYTVYVHGYVPRSRANGSAYVRYTCTWYTCTMRAVVHGCVVWLVAHTYKRHYARRARCILVRIINDTEPKHAQLTVHNSSTSDTS